MSWPKFSIGLGAHSDANIRYLSNYLFALDFSQLREWLFSQGSLAFLQFPLPIRTNRIWAYCILVILRLIILSSVLKSPPTWKRSLAWKSLIYLILIQVAGHHQIGLVSIMALVLWDNGSEMMWKKVVLLGLVALLWQIRLIPAIAALLLVSGYFIFERRSLVWALFSMATPLFSDLIFLQDLTLVALKWQGLIALALNNASLSEPGLLKTPFLLITWLGLSFIIVSQLKAKSISWLIFLSFLCIYYFKRPDLGTAMVLTKVSFSLLLLLFLQQSVFKYRSAVVYGVSILAFVGLFKFWFPSGTLFQKWRPQAAWKEFFEPQSSYQELTKQLKEIRRVSDRSPKSIQVFPGHYLGFLLPGDSLLSGPIPQAYYILNSQLDSLQANSLLPPNHPSRVYVHLDPMSHNLKVGRQSLWHKAPQYFKVLFQHYYLDSANGKYMVFKKRSRLTHWQIVDHIKLSNKPVLLNLDCSKYAYRITSGGLHEEVKLVINGESFSLSLLNVQNGAQISPLALNRPYDQPISLGLDGKDSPVILEKIPLYQSTP